MWHRRPTAVVGVQWVRFPSEVILLAVRWYLRFGLSYRDLEELLAERCVGREEAWAEIDHELTRFETATGFEGPCELLVASGTK